MGFVPNVIALKEAGTRPSAEGILVRFARIQPIKSLEDASRVAEQDPDLVLIDTRMPTLKSQHVAEAVRAHSSRSAILLLDFKQSPGSVRRQLNNLATLVAPHHGRALDIPRMARILNTSQEGLSRILNISARTAHRWMKGTRPRPKPELTRLSQVISLLLDTLPSEEAATRYLSHSNRSLNGETPLALFARGEFDRVEADIQAVREGVYVQLRSLTGAPQTALSATLYRIVRSGIDPLSSHGSQLSGGRYNFPGLQGVLYASFEKSTAIAEIRRGLTARGINPRDFAPSDWWLYELGVSFTKILDLTNPKVLEHLQLPATALVTGSITIPRQIGNEALDAGFEAIVAPSVGHPGKNLVIFLTSASQTPQVLSAAPINISHQVP